MCLEGTNVEDYEEELTGTEIMLPTLAMLNYNLEQATTYPGKALIYLKKIYCDTDILLKLQKTTSNQEDFDRAFTRGIHKEDIGEKID